MHIRIKVRAVVRDKVNSVFTQTELCERVGGFSAIGVGLKGGAEVGVRVSS